MGKVQQIVLFSQYIWNGNSRWNFSWHSYIFWVESAESHFTSDASPLRSRSDSNPPSHFPPLRPFLWAFLQLPLIEKKSWCVSAFKWFSSLEYKNLIYIHPKAFLFPYVPSLYPESISFFCYVPPFLFPSAFTFFSISPHSYVFSISLPPIFFFSRSLALSLVSPSSLFIPFSGEICPLFSLRYRKGVLEIWVIFLFVQTDEIRSLEVLIREGFGDRASPKYRLFVFI